jgi:hypothetical protein
MDRYEYLKYEMEVWGLYDVLEYHQEIHKVNLERVKRFCDE